MNDHLDRSGAEDGPEMPNRTSKGKFVHYLRRLQPARTRSEWGHLVYGTGLGIVLTYAIIRMTLPTPEEPVVNFTCRYFVLWLGGLLLMPLGVGLARKKRATNKKRTPPQIEHSEAEQSGDISILSGTWLALSKPAGRGQVVVDRKRLTGIGLGSQI